ncbi:MAG: glutamine-synthetase adenylyltransferase [Paracoccaceae bacterium]|nr:glutamine-synthetase adenylyltransferase [Paracoccaceae bacterium]MDG2373903.1 glutamine-synthetase adenylyltransferase [Paracoccaceae bacterium]
MRFLDQINKVPTPFNKEAGEAIALLFSSQPNKINQLIRGVGGCSPYLKGLLEIEYEWVLSALDSQENILNAEFSRLKKTPSSEIKTALRVTKRRVALWSALCDFSGIWELNDVTNMLTQFADLACQLALKVALETELSRGNIPGLEIDHSPEKTGMFVLAMGKMGAHELNYSSDIDLICFFDETQFLEEKYFDARKGFIRATRLMSSILSDLTEDGYVFRTDLRLRPDPSVNPVCIATETAERYYESLGRTWERAAYIKARVVAGDTKAGINFLHSLTPFVWRKYLDFAAIEDAHDIRLRIREHKGLGGALKLLGHNIKLGSGGIREIEFFTQTRQLIAGGRDIDLRVRGTIDGLKNLSKKGWINKTVSEKLISHYTLYRNIEHRLQMVHDAQTHDLPKSIEGMERLSCMMGTTPDLLAKDLLFSLKEVNQLTEGFFKPTKLDLTFSLSEMETKVVDRWRSYPSLRSPRAEHIFNRLRPKILEKIRSTDKSNNALIAFDKFLVGLPTGVQLFSLFEANPQLIDLLVDIVGTAPALANHLAKSPVVFDAVIGGDFWTPWPKLTTLERQLSNLIKLETGYEQKLEVSRKWKKEWHFRIGVHLLRGITNVNQAGTQYAELAETVLKVIFPVVISEFSKKYGKPPGRGASIFSMGSLGATHLNSTSDLDLIVIYDAEGIEFSDCPTPLNSRLYYTRLTQALVTAMTVEMSQGKLYEVDMRLRPSGRKGPVATSWTSFKDYQTNEAWAWEHLALTRGRVICGNSELSINIEDFRLQLIKNVRPEVAVRSLKEMREKIQKIDLNNNKWEFKQGIGRMQDIELFSQLSTVINGQVTRDVSSGLIAGSESGLLTNKQLDQILKTYKFLKEMNMATRLINDPSQEFEKISTSGHSFILKLTKINTIKALNKNFEFQTKRVAKIINTVLLSFV